MLLPMVEWVVVLLLDVITKVRAAGESGDLHCAISRGQTIVIVIMLVFWYSLFYVSKVVMTLIHYSQLD